jgi:tryptophan synthase alpha chain
MRPAWVHPRIRTGKDEQIVGRISQTFERLRVEKRTGLVAFVTAGDPTLARTKDILSALERAGADVIEIGVPFSDPLADGPVIQRATERALAGGTTLEAVIELVAEVRLSMRLPMVLFTYANPLVRMGLAEFARRASAAGVDGVLILDLPIEESEECRGLLDAHGLDTIFLLSPTTTQERIRRAAQLGRGFLYGISRLGVTGARAAVAAGATELAERIRRETTLPVALGFGISHPDHVREVGRFADAAVVGSALVQVIADAGDSERLVPAVDAYVRWLKGTGPQPERLGAPAGQLA